VSLNSHKDYIEQFASTFYDQVKRLIDKNQEIQHEFKQLNSTKNDEALFHEVLDHAYFCNETAHKFHGRQDLLIEVNQN
jgi:DNA-binding transcriptional regulator GbsR (MarR family)